MKNFFTKAFVAVGVMASALALSSMAVFAGTGDFSFGPDSFFTSAEINSAKSGTQPSTVSVSGDNFEATITNKGFTPGALGTFATQKEKTLTNDTGKNFSYEALAGGDRTITVTPVSSGTATVYVYHDGSKTFKINGNAVDQTATGYTVTGYDVSCVAGTSFTIDLATNIAFVGCDFVEGSVNEYTWAIDTSKLSVVSPSEVALKDETTTSLKNTFSTSSKTYNLKNAYKTITDSTEGVRIDGYSITVTPDDSWFEAKPIAKKVTSAVGETKVYSYLSGDDNDEVDDGDAIGEYFTAVSNGLNIVMRVNKDSGVYCVQTQPLEKAAIQFETTVPLNISVSFGSTSSKNKSDLALKAADGDQIGATAEITGTSGGVLEIEDLPAGVYQMYSSGKDRGARVFSVTFSEPTTSTIASTQKLVGGDYFYTDGSNTYVVHPVSSAEMDYTALIADGVADTKTSTVYTTIEFPDKSTVSVDKSANSTTNVEASALYAFLMTGTQGQIPSSSTINWQQVAY